MLRDTSIQAHKEIKPYKPTQHDVIMNFMREYPEFDFSRQELVEETGLDNNSINGRVCELKDLGMLEEGPKRRCSITGKTVHPLRIKKENN